VSPPGQSVLAVHDLLHDAKIYDVGVGVGVRVGMGVGVSAYTIVGVDVGHGVAPAVGVGVGVSVGVAVGCKVGVGVIGPWHEYAGCPEHAERFVVHWPPADGQQYVVPPHEPNFTNVHA